MSDRQFQESKHVALQRQGWHCMRCGRNLHDPSVWPGRSSTCEAMASVPRHGWTHAHPAEAERSGYIIPSWRDPLSVPIRDWNGDWWWLLDDGTAQRLTQIEIIEWQSNWKEES